MSYFCCYAIVLVIWKFQPNIWFRDLPLAWAQARLDVLLVLYVLGVVGSGGGEWQWRNSKRVPERPAFSNPFLLPCCYLFGLEQRREEELNISMCDYPWQGAIHPLLVVTAAVFLAFSAFYKPGAQMLPNNAFGGSPRYLLRALRYSCLVCQTWLRFGLFLPLLTPHQPPSYIDGHITDHLWEHTWFPVALR